MQIRPGTVADVPAIARVYVDSWKATYEGLMPEVFLKGMTDEAALKIFTESFQSNTHSYRTLVAETPEGRLVGFTDYGQERSHPETGWGEIYGLYLLKDFQKQGTGTQLFNLAMEDLSRSGLTSVIVWVLDKSPYRRFYEKSGGKLKDMVKKLGPPGNQIHLVPYIWNNTGP